MPRILRLIRMPLPGPSASAIAMGALAGCTAGLLLADLGHGVWKAVAACAAGSLPAFASMAAPLRSRFIGRVLSLLAQCRTLPMPERCLATALLCVAAHYVQISAGFDGGPLALTVTAPVALTAVCFGLDFGVAAALAISVANYFVFIPPRFSIWFESWRDLREIAGSMLVGVCAAIIFEATVRALAARRLRG